MIEPAVASAIVQRVEESSLAGAALRRFAMDQLSGLPAYNWCGIYRLERDELLLDEFVGEATDHVRIPVGRGVCGTAVAENANQIVEDVSALDNYLACSLTTKSEIVVLIRDDSGAILGQIDIDGHTKGAFDQSDERFLERLAWVLAEGWES